MDKLRARFPHILTLEFRPAGATADPRGYRERVAGRDDLTVAAEFVSHVRGGVAVGRRVRPARAGLHRRPRGPGSERLTMRPHRLAVTAFGAFAAAEQVVFDDLDGLFLLHGETGAGKTTLLDAIAFALYGRVPGERGSARRLRSDHARGGVATEVELEATIGGRRLRITRRPEQDRPRKSGGGTTRDQASIRLAERDADGDWTVTSARLGEADREIADLMGMSAEQFFQVVLLPQGQFAQFLHARAQEKEALLQKLFGTDRFSQVADWLADRRRATDKEVAAAEEDSDPPGSPAGPGRRRRGPGIRIRTPRWRCRGPASTAACRTPPTSHAPRAAGRRIWASAPLAARRGRAGRSSGAGGGPQGGPGGGTCRQGPCRAARRPPAPSPRGAAQAAGTPRRDARTPAAARRPGIAARGGPGAAGPGRAA